VLSVYLDNIAEPVCSTKIEISKLINSESAWIGFTGATGGLNQRQDILSWKFQISSASLADTPSQISTNVPSQISTHTPSPLSVANTPSQLSSIISNTYMVSDKPNFAGIMKKIESYNTKAIVKLTESDITELNNMISVLQNTSFYHNSSISRKPLYIIEKVITNWPEEELFPVIDLLRSILAHPEGVKQISQYGAFAGQSNIIQRILLLISSKKKYIHHNSYHLNF